MCNKVGRQTNEGVYMDYRDTTTDGTELVVAFSSWRQSATPWVLT